MTGAASYQPLGPGELADTRSLGDFKFTDFGNAERLVQMYGDEMLYVPEWKVWLVWDGRRWRPDTDGKAQRNAKQTVRALYAVATTTEDEDRRKRIAAWATRSEQAQRLKEMLNLAQTEAGMFVRPDQLDTHPWLLNVQNGTLDLQTGELRAHERADLLTKVLPIAYSPKAKCPRFDRFLKEVLPEPKERAFLQRAIGYSLTGLTVQEVMFMLVGPGSNGKSKLLETLRLLFGPFAQTAPTKLLMQDAFQSIPADLARLPGARFVTVIESERGQRLAEGTIKSLTSGDRMSARGLYQSPFEFTPTCKIWLATNHLPTIKGDDDGIWRRIILFHFNQRITGAKRDLHLGEKLKAELPGILRWGVEGVRAWQNDGFNPPESVVQAVVSYREQQDVPGQFLRDCTITQEDGWASTDALFQAYTAWCDHNGIRYPMTKGEIGKLMAERGYEESRRWSSTAVKGTKRKRVRGWSGLTLTEDER